MYNHSDSSEGHGNKWRNHGYQLYKQKDTNKNVSHPDDKLYKLPEKNHSFTTFTDLDKNYFCQKEANSHSVRSHVKEGRNADSKSEFKHDLNSKFCFERDSYEPARKKPLISKDDVYDLLSKSRAQEEKVAELQSRNNVQQKNLQPYSADRYGNTQSPHKQGHDTPSSRITARSKYSQFSLSRLRLSRITAYLEEKIWSLF